MSNFPHTLTLVVLIEPYQFLPSSFPPYAVKYYVFVNPVHEGTVNESIRSNISFPPKYRLSIGLSYQNSSVPIRKIIAKTSLRYVCFLVGGNEHLGQFPPPNFECFQMCRFQFSEEKPHWRKMVLNNSGSENIINLMDVKRESGRQYVFLLKAWNDAFQSQFLTVKFSDINLILPSFGL